MVVPAEKMSWERVSWDSSGRGSGVESAESVFEVDGTWRLGGTTGVLNLKNPCGVNSIAELVFSGKEQSIFIYNGVN